MILHVRMLDVTLEIIGNLVEHSWQVLRELFHVGIFV